MRSVEHAREERRAATRRRPTRRGRPPGAGRRRGRTAAPSGRASASTSSAPAATACAASALTASRARRMPASGSKSVKRTSSTAMLGNSSRRVDALARDPLGAQDGLARGLPAVVAAREPGHAAVDDEARVDLVPQRPGAPRRARVPGVGAVAAADEARLVARAGAHVAGRDALDEHDVPAGQRAVARQRGAEHAGADDDERAARLLTAGRLAAGRRSVLDAQRLGGRASRPCRARR